MRERLGDLVREAEAGFSGRLSLAFHPFGGEAYLHDAEHSMRAASLIKLPLLVQALDEVAQGRLKLNERLTLAAEDQVGGAGLLQYLEPGLRPSLHDLLTLMIIVSDNTATNLIISLLGEERVNAFLHDLGLGQTRLVGKLQLPPERQNERQRRGDVNQTSAADVLGLLLGLERGELLPAGETELAKTILKQQQFSEALARYLPCDAELHEHPIAVASKSGSLRGLRHDAGLVYDAGGKPLYALVVMTDGSQDQGYGLEQEGTMLIARLSRAIYDLCGSREAGRPA